MALTLARQLERVLVFAAHTKRDFSPRAVTGADAHVSANAAGEKLGTRRHAKMMAERASRVIFIVSRICKGAGCLRTG